MENFNFAATASKFVSDPAIISGAYPAAIGAAAGAPQVFDLFVTLEKLAAGKTPATPASNVTGTGTSTGNQGGGNQVVSAANFVVHACRRTGRFITIAPPNGTPGNPQPQKFENCVPVGAYGYGVTHVGTTAVNDWTFDLRDGNGNVMHPNGGIYRFEVPQGSKGKVTTEINPKPTSQPHPNKFAVFFDLGGAFPHGNFGSVFNPGFSLNTGLEYIVNSHFSAEGIFGYDHFSASGGGSLNVYQFSGNAKAYLTTGTLRPFVNGGVGGYHFGTASTYFGGNFGAGVLKELNSHWGIQGAYNFHAVKTPGGATKFSTVQGGIRYVF